jgi:hypothetical protein
MFRINVCDDRGVVESHHPINPTTSIVPGPFEPHVAELNHVARCDLRQILEAPDSCRSALY